MKQRRGFLCLGGNLIHDRKGLIDNRYAIMGILRSPLYLFDIFFAVF